MKMKIFITFFTFLFYISNSILGQSFNHTVKVLNENENGTQNVKVNLLKSSPTITLSNNLNVRVFSTHSGNGSTSQYSAYPMVTSEFDRLFNTNFSATRLHWQGSININTSLNWNNWTIIRNAGALVPNNGDFFSVEVSGTFIPTETGIYSFGINSDDGSDLFIGNNFVVSFYGGHGMSGFIFGSINLVAGVEYNFRARVQEYGGGEGLQVIWRRPSQGQHFLHTGELFTKITTMSQFILEQTYYTNVNGEVNISNNLNSNEILKIQIEEPLFSNAIYLDDFVEIIDICLQKINLKSYYFHKWDLNDDNSITISDAYINFTRINNNIYDKKTFLFTSSQWNILKNESVNLKFTIPGQRNVLEYDPINNTTSTFYIITQGIKNQNIIQYQQYP